MAIIVNSLSKFHTQRNILHSNVNLQSPVSLLRDHPSLSLTSNYWKFILFLPFKQISGIIHYSLAIYFILFYLHKLNRVAEIDFKVNEISLSDRISGVFC